MMGMLNIYQDRFQGIVPLHSEVSYEFGASLGCTGITAIHAVNSIGKVKLGDMITVYGNVE